MKKNIILLSCLLVWFGSSITLMVYQKSHKELSDLRYEIKAREEQKK